jgi:hypothetical protein
MTEVIFCVAKQPHATHLLNDGVDIILDWIGTAVTRLFILLPSLALCEEMLKDGLGLCRTCHRPFDTYLVCYVASRNLELEIFGNGIARIGQAYFRIYKASTWLRHRLQFEESVA